MGEAALRLERLDQLLEGQVLVAVGGEGHLAETGHQGARRGVARQAGAESEGVDEETDEVFGLGTVAVGDGRADDHLLLPRPAPEEGRESGEEQHERGRPLPACLPFEGRGQPGRQEERQLARAVPLDRRPRPVGGQLEEGRGAGEPRLPPGDLPRQHLSR